MLHPSLRANHAYDATNLPRRSRIEGAIFFELLTDARDALAHDVQAVHHCLDRLAALVEQPVSADEDNDLLIPPTGLVDRDAAPVKGGLAPWQLRRVVAYIDDNLSGPVFVDALASTVRLSAGHFCRAFKASVGETPHTFLVRQRVRRAQSLMLNTSNTLSQIACACGLTDQAHLTRLFRKFVGDTPLTWRRTWQHS